ncbi:MAG: class I SAM-dependent methyltransferase [Acidimicrobiales bacterium]|nr:class I SAM-dependent methyltransferase [Acidimicrobiales bacterium]
MRGSSETFPPGFGPQTYGESFADVYDRWYHDVTDAAGTARFLAERCVSPSVLELGVGTGRLVAELVGAGLDVVGVDSSLAMMRGPGAGPLRAVADISALPFRVGRRFGGAICAFNTLFNLPTAELQQLVLAETAAVTTGPIVVEALTGAALADADVQSLGISRLTSDSLVLAATVVDHDAQTVTGQHVDITPAGITLRPWHLRWTTPPQLDRMAAEVGLELAERYSDWNGSLYDQFSETHVSVYRH